MFCKHCGQRLSDEARFCPVCGTATEPKETGGAAQTAQTDWQQQQGQQSGWQQQQQNWQQQQQPNWQQQPPQQPGGWQQPPQQPGWQPLPMRWYKFVIWVQLLLSIVVNLLQALGMALGWQYDTDITRSQLRMIYRYFSGLQTVDIIMIILSVLVACAAFFVRQRLAHFKIGAPKHYLLFLIAVCVINVFYIVAVSIILSGEGASLDYTSPIAQLATSLIMIVANSAYFKRRAHLFNQK